MIKLDEYIQFEDTPVIFKQVEGKDYKWEILIFSAADFKESSGYDRVLWGDSNIPYYCLCMFAADSYFGVDGYKFTYYKNKYEKIKNIKWNAGFVKR